MSSHAYVAGVGMIPFEDGFIYSSSGHGHDHLQREYLFGRFRGRDCAASRGRAVRRNRDSERSMGRQVHAVVVSRSGAQVSNLELIPPCRTAGDFPGQHRISRKERAERH